MPEFYTTEVAILKQDNDLEWCGGCDGGEHMCEESGSAFWVAPGWCAIDGVDGRCRDPECSKRFVP